MEEEKQWMISSKFRVLIDVWFGLVSQVNWRSDGKDANNSRKQVMVL